jgi:prepilin-type N-terminal cleavage/methylation domain-containing protein
MTFVPARGRGRRPAFTLLELILAMSLAVVLLAGLYLAMSIQLKQARAGRGMVQTSAQVRALLARIETDILHQVAPIDPKQNGTASLLVTGVSPGGGLVTGGGSSGSGGSGSGSGSGASGGSGGSGSGGSSMASGSGSGGSGSGGSGSSATNLTPGVTNNTSGPIVANLGVQGDATHLSLYISQLPGEVFQNYLSQNQSQVALSDLRRVNYWLAGNGGGLARYEEKVATTQETLTPGVFDPGSVSEQDCVISKDVVDLSFQYFDGTQWNDTWDGTQVQADGITPMGPPQAIAINLKMRRVGAPPGAADDQQTVSFRYVVAIPTANNLNSVSNTSNTVSGQSITPPGTSGGSSGSTGQ